MPEKNAIARPDGSLSPFERIKRTNDAETGMMLYRNRIYHVEFGRFGSKDPIGYDSRDENLYRYVLNSPCNYGDPNGLVVPIVVGAGVVGALALCAKYQMDIAYSRYGSRSDEFLHCWTSCRISKACSAYVSQLAGTGKEIFDMIDGTDWDHAYNVDWKANQTCIGWEGYAFGLVGSWIGAVVRQGCEDCCCKAGYH